MNGPGIPLIATVFCRCEDVGMTKASPDFSVVRVKVPFLFPVEHPGLIQELRTCFPGVEVQAASVDRVIVGGELVCDELTDVYEWTLEHLPKQGSGRR